jgi:hypothetical protein
MMRANPSLSAVSLRVGPESPAVRLFERFGFNLAAQNEEGVTMRREL